MLATGSAGGEGCQRYFFGNIQMVPLIRLGENKELRKKGHPDLVPFLRFLQ